MDDWITFCRNENWYEHGKLSNIHFKIVAFTQFQVSVSMPIPCSGIGFFIHWFCIANSQSKVYKYLANAPVLQYVDQIGKLK